jgi:hypothetical protein
MYCSKQLYTSCDVTNPQTEGLSYTNIQEKLYGHRTGALQCQGTWCECRMLHRLTLVRQHYWR